MHTTTQSLAQLAETLGYTLKGRPLTTKEAGELLCTAPATLADWRVNGDGPRYYKVGDKLVRYAERDLLEWLAAGARTSTSQLAAA
jgi:hypothetical protein